MFQELTNLIQQINSNQSIIDTIAKEKQTNDGAVVYISNFLNDDVTLSEEARNLLNQLDSYLCGEFISNTGSYSKKVYEAMRYGFKLKTLESDSFGPLISGLTDPSDNWIFAYG